ncbi:ATP-binding protein [Aliinostoc sp. HNIBRCY26]|uniref:ATP-binding protein n=1 Tax=Aliinostoc sp. HNIBRCY26 TaxID=3418997 RepID=UPI003D00A890
MTPNPINFPRYPLNFKQIITTKNHNFVGRKFVFHAINNFLHQSDRGYFTIIGEPGIGKSAILAHYVTQNPGVVYYNVEIVGDNTEEFLSIICTQLIEIAQNQGSEYPTVNFSNFTNQNSDIFWLLLQQISDRLHPEQRLIITIDGCDMIDVKNQVCGSNILYLPRYLPENVYFILARRPFIKDKSGLLTETPMQSLDLSDYVEENRADAQEYIKIYLNYDGNIQGDKLLTKIGDHEINFMYINEMLTVTNDQIYSDNLQKYYQSHFKKMNLSVIKQQTIALDVLNMLVQEQSISTEVIAAKLDIDEYEIKVILDKWREFLHLELKVAKIFYRVYHANFHDWLKQQIKKNLNFDSSI